MFFRKKVNELEIFKCAQGDIVPIENVPDSVFADKLLGDGIAINPSNGEIISPIDGQVVMIQDSLHAIGIQSDDGIEILIHVGLDTVELKGEGFVKKVNINDRVNQGQPIVYFDKEMIEEKGYNTITMMIVINDERISKLEKGNQLDKPLIKVYINNKTVAICESLQSFYILKNKISQSISNTKRIIESAIKL